MESKDAVSNMKKLLKLSVLLLPTALLITINIVLFRQFLFQGKVPIAFDYGVYSYQPWKIDYQDTFKSSPKKIGHDDIRIFYPQRKFVTDSLKNGQIPFWNPYEFAGNVSLANSQTATFYPPFLLFLFLPLSTAWSWLSFSIPIIASVGMLLFLREIVKDNLSSTFGAVVFAFSSAIITRSEDGLVAGHSIIWLPWVLFGIELFYRRRKTIGCVIITLSLIFSMLAGWFQFTFYVFITSALYAIYRSFCNKETSRLKQILIISLIFFFSIGLTSFHWLPAIEALRFSPRGVLGVPSEFAKEHLMPIAHLITLVIPNFFGHIATNTYFGASEFKEGVITIGLVAFLLALTGVKAKIKHGVVRFFSFLFFASLLLGLKTPIAEALIKLNLPLISTFLPNRVFIIATFALSVLSAFGLKSVIKGKTHSLVKTTRVAIFIIFGFYLTIVAWYGYEKAVAPLTGFSLFRFGFENYLRISAKESLLPLLMAILLLICLKKIKTKNKKALAVVLFSATIISQLFRANRYLYFSSKESEFPQNPIFSFLQKTSEKDASRFLSLSYSKIPANLTLFYNIFNPEGVDAMYPVWYGEFSEFFNRRNPSLKSANRIEVSFAEELEKPKKVGVNRWFDLGTLNFLSLLGVRFVIVPKDYHYLPPEETFEKVLAYRWHTVYEYKYAFPKAYFVPNYLVSNNKYLTLQRLFLPEFLPSSQVIISTSEAKKIPDIYKRERHLNTNEDLYKKYDLRGGELARKKEEPNTSTFVKEALDKLSQNPVELIHYSPNKVILRANLKDNGFIVLNDSYFPGWKAQVDGLTQPVLRANHAFRAVEVESGEHTIVFSFKPQSFVQGIKISLATAAITLSISALMFVGKKKNSKLI